MPRPAHFEIHATDPARAIAFYEQIFGWTFQQWGDQEYWLIITGPDDEPGINGGLLPRNAEAPAAGLSPNGYVCTVQVDDVEGTVKLATEAGATVQMPVSAMPGVGLLAYLADPDGNHFGVLQAEPEATSAGE
jgi:hypothetical protein